MKKKKRLHEKYIKILLVIIFFPLALIHLLITNFQKSKYKPKGKFVQVGNNNYHVKVSGKGSPTIILESGQGGCSLDWVLVQGEISNLGTVISYDRANYGWSKTKENKSTIDEYVDELRSLLDKLELRPPYILVGHSFGGLIMRLFASKYAEDVEGLILVDSVHEDRYTSELMSLDRRKQFNNVIKQAKLGYLLAPLGITRIIKAFIGSKNLPKQEQKIVKALGYQSKAYTSLLLELLNSEGSVRQLKVSKPIEENLPVIILSAGKQTDDWKEEQYKLLKITNNTEHLIVTESWHSIQIHKPEVVIKAITDMLEITGSCAPLTPHNTVSTRRAGSALGLEEKAK